MSYWRSVPPVAESVAAFLGVEPAEEDRKYGDLDDLIRELGGIPGMNVKV